MRAVLLLCLSLVVLHQPAAYGECECLWQGSFSEVQADTDIVVAGTVEMIKGNAIDLTISDTLRGENLPPEIRVWLKTEDYCRPEVEFFPLESNWVMALERIDEDIPGGFNPNTPNFSYGRIGDYQLSSCGGYWLHLKEGRVSGNLVNAPRWVHDPEMTPVLLELLKSYVEGEVSVETLLEASREDPELRELMLDTKTFLRGNRL